MCISSFWNWLSNNASNVIAICAFGATFWQAHLTRKHNKLSVKPYLTTWTTMSSDGYSVLKIINNGIGPAHIKSFKILVDGQKMVGEALEPHDKCLKLLFPEYKYDWYGSYLGVGYMMRSHEERDLIAIKFIGEKMPEQVEVEHRAKRVQILIKYESIYKEEDDYDSQREVKKQESQS
jgi:hypothetical protein